MNKPTEFGFSTRVLNMLIGVFKTFESIDAVLIFGSRAAGNYTNSSDIDLAVFSQNLTAETMFELRRRLRNLGLLYRIDCLHYETCKHKNLKQQIDTVGKLLYKQEHF